MLARAWGVPPWVVDAAPWYEVQNELQMLRIEQDAARWKAQRGH